MQEVAHDLVLVVDFGAQYAQLIARRVREARVYSEIVPHTCRSRRCWPGSPRRSSSPAVRRRCTSPGHRRSTRRLFEAGVPVVRHLLRVPADGPGDRWPGRAHRGPRVRPTQVPVAEPGVLLADLPVEHRCGCPTATRWRRRRAGFTVLAVDRVTPVAAFENLDRGLAGVQWHPEVLHTEHGQQRPRALPARHRRVPADLDDGQHRRGAGRAIRAQVGDGRAICGLSGGVDSAVAAALVQRADRRPAHLRLRRPRAAALGRGRAGRARTSWRRPGST